MRAFPAALGSLTVPVVYAIMKESGYPTVVSAFSACLVLFGQSIFVFEFCSGVMIYLYFTLIDNAHIAQDRLILLDAQLVFFIALTIYAYVRFKKLRYQ